MCSVDGGWNRHHEELGRLEVGRIRREGDVAPVEGLLLELFAGVDALLHLLHPSGVDVESDHADVAGKGQGNGEANIAQADDGEGGDVGRDFGSVFGNAPERAFGSTETVLELAAASCVWMSPGFTRLKDLSRISTIWASRVRPVRPPNTTPISLTPARSTVATRLNPDALI